MKILKVNIDCINNGNKYKWFVYGIKNKITNKYYIGSCTNKRGICDRFRRHIYHLKLNTHHSQKLQRSFDKYDKDLVKWEFILFEEITKENYKIREQYYINKFDSYNNGYNSTPLVGVVNHGVMSDKHKKAISDSKQNMLDMDIVDIFQKYNDGLHYRKIGKFYNLSAPTISSIINNNKYYSDVKKTHNLKKERYFYIFYNLIENKFYKVDNFTKFCRDNNLNNKMMMQLMSRKIKMTFLKNWTVFRKENFSLTELRNKIKINNKIHILYKDNIKYQFKNVKIFCKEHKLDGTTTYHVLNGKKESVKGFTLQLK
jgi:hypothetical protein